MLRSALFHCFIIFAKIIAWTNESVFGVRVYMELFFLRSINTKVVLTLVPIER